MERGEEIAEAKDWLARATELAAAEQGTETRAKLAETQAKELAGEAKQEEG